MKGTSICVCISVVETKFKQSEIVLKIASTTELYDFIANASMTKRLFEIHFSYFLLSSNLIKL